MSAFETMREAENLKGRGMYRTAEGWFKTAATRAYGEGRDNLGRACVTLARDCADARKVNAVGRIVA